MDQDTQRIRHSYSASWIGFLIGPAFLAVALWFLYGPKLTTVPQTKAVSFPIEMLSTSPRRQIIGDPPIIEIDNFKRTCAECHQVFDVNAKSPGKRLQHQHIELDHGINDQCRNCHNYDDMNQLVLYSGEPIRYSEVPKLCQKCHGPVYMDWERGIHGRVNDYWSEELGEPRRLKCIECHDPHQPRHPAMDPLKPLPAPNTLRMGTKQERDHGAHEYSGHDPLRAALLKKELPADESANSSATHKDNGE